MSQFPSIAGYGDTTELLDPADPATFETCKIDWSERETNAHVVDLHRDLLRLRKHDPVFSRQDKTAIEGAVIGPEAFVLRWFDDADDDRLAIFNLGAEIDSYPLAEPLQAPPPDRNGSYCGRAKMPATAAWARPSLIRTTGACRDTWRWFSNRPLNNHRVPIGQTSARCVSQLRCRRLACNVPLAVWHSMGTPVGR